MTSRKCLPELLYRPFRRRVRGDVVMNNSSAAQFHQDEDVQCAEVGGDYDEEVAGRRLPERDCGRRPANGFWCKLGESGCTGIMAWNEASRDGLVQRAAFRPAG